MFELECPTCSSTVRAVNGRRGATFRCLACRASTVWSIQSVRRRDVRDDDDEPLRPRRKRARRKRAWSTTAIVLVIGIALGALVLVGSAAAFVLANAGVFGSRTYPDLTPEQFNRAVKSGMTEQQATSALGPPTRRRSIAIQYERGGVTGGWTGPVKTEGIRLTWVIYESAHSWKSCWADLDRDGGTIVSTGSGGGSSN